MRDKPESKFLSVYEIYLKIQQKWPRDKTVYTKLIDICKKLGRPEESRKWSEKWKDQKNV